MPITLAESGIYAALGFTLAITVMIAVSIRWLGRNVPVDPLAATLAACGFFAGIGLVASPAMTEQPLAGILILDNTLVGYLLPVAFAATAWARAHLARPPIARAYGVAAILGALAYVVTRLAAPSSAPTCSALMSAPAALFGSDPALWRRASGARFPGPVAGSAPALLGIVTMAICKAWLAAQLGGKHRDEETDLGTCSVAADRHRAGRGGLHFARFATCSRRQTYKINPPQQGRVFYDTAFVIE